ncbi:MAG: oxoacyl-ACP reductase [Deltaproteobacteria bacterium]|nr:oxoacyl-ACP reductase [Deltaproteobacteria bacterium]
MTKVVRNEQLLGGNSSVGLAWWQLSAPAHKFGVEGLTQVWADELGREGIRVKALNPGRTRTRTRAFVYPEENPQTLPTLDDIAPVFVWLTRADTQVFGQSLEARLARPATGCLRAC